MKRFLVALVAMGIVTSAFFGCTPVDSGPTNANLTFAWTATGDDGIIGQATGYSLRYSASQDSLINSWESVSEVAGVPAPAGAGTSESFSSVVVLETGVEYYFAIKAVDDAGNWSEISNIVSKTIPDEFPPATIVDFSVTRN